MGTPVVRTLVVDDFEEWRRELRAILEEKLTLRVVGEAANGLEAVERAQALRPDLILLDIGLPALNGIEVARVIHDLGIPSKILFVSENRRPDVAEEALQTGAYGYVVKSQAGSELLPAIETVMLGRRFISPALHIEAPPSEKELDDPPGHKPALAPLPPRNIAIRHEVAFYANDAELEAGFARTSQRILEVGGTVLLIATGSHSANVYRRLQSTGIDLERATRTGQFLQLDSNDALSSILVNGIPDSTRCASLLRELISAAKRTNGTHQRVAICGEIAPLLLANEGFEGTLLLEQIWDEVTRAHSVHTLCGYLSDSVPESVFHRICAEHSAIYGRELGY